MAMPQKKRIKKSGEKIGKTLDLAEPGTESLTESLAESQPGCHV